MKEKFAKMTMDEIRTSLDEQVNAWNASTDPSEKISLKVEIKDGVQAYNELSMLTVYADCIKAEMPVIEFIKTYYYPVIRLKEAVVSEKNDEGRLVAYIKLSIQEINDTKGEPLYKNLDLVKFLEWANDRNTPAAYAKDWKSKLLKARNVINTECENNINSKDGYKIKKGKIKDAVQSAFDAIVFIPCENAKDKNAIIAKGSLVDHTPFLAAQIKEECKSGSPEFEIKYFTVDHWYKTIMQYLSITIGNKEFNVAYDDAQPEAEPTPEAETEA